MQIRTGGEGWTSQTIERGGGEDSWCSTIEVTMRLYRSSRHNEEDEGGEVVG